ncbi:class I SAM-dependent methyltransferase [Trichormus variabilis]|nr:class I SAM-dependent methyltransferase [Trichormus variabilis]MBD2626923.1 methyltransferase domain-containing protein [Trichormus variabilis FACHB-164]
MATPPYSNQTGFLYMFKFKKHTNTNSRSAHLPPHLTMHYLPEHTESILDVGCNVGLGLKFASELGVKKLYGIDINPQAIELARDNLKDIDQVELYHNSADRLPIRDASVDAVNCTEVLEHIPFDLRPCLIEEIHRVLANNGILLITVPARGLFHFLDPANFRLMFPSLFNTVSKLVGGSGRELGYAEQKHDIVWHYHFTIPELKALLEPLFNIYHIRGRGCFFSPICNWLEWPFYRMNRMNNILYKTISKLHQWDMSCDWGMGLAYNVLIVAEKKSDLSES